MGTLRFTVQPEPGGARVCFSGVLDEAADLSALGDQVGAGQVVLDLRGIERANSLGLKHWIEVLGRLARQCRLVIEACSPPMAFQANLVSNLFAGAEVRSCMAPYYCSECSQEFTTLVAREDVDSIGGGAPKKDCPSCGTPAEFDDLEMFFGFMR